MSIEYVCRETERAVRHYGERDPERLARAMKLLLCYAPMGLREDSCKGFFMQQSRKKVIVINADLSRNEQRIILAHELGHAVLHRKELSALHAFHDFSLSETTNRCEYEANLFAAELLLSDERVAELLGEDNFFFGAAAELEVPPELLDFKFRILKNKGWSLESPIQPHGDFLRRMPIAGDIR